jgi:hypothetical protein
MKLLFVCLMLSSLNVVAAEKSTQAPTRMIASTSYSLMQICNHYTDALSTCKAIPFCHVESSSLSGCHQRPDIGFGEELCVTFSQSQCNPQITACQWYAPSAPTCNASRGNL